MLEELMIGKYGGYSIMLGLFGLIVFLLRILFGPKGFFRDPAWDRRNEEIRQEEQIRREARRQAWQKHHAQESGEENSPLLHLPSNTKYQDLLSRPLPAFLEEHWTRFFSFALPHIEDEKDAPLQLKAEHSVYVLGHVQVLLEECTAAISPSMRDAALLAALYHDCGRFPQFKRYGTFSDALSVNHARLGVQVIREQQFFSQIERNVAKLAMMAVALHNVYALPQKLHPDAALVTHMVRDADKLDIIRVMSTHLDNFVPKQDTVVLNVKDVPECYSEKILQDLLEGRVPRYGDLHYINDFRLLLGAWPRDLHFAASRTILAASGHMEKIIADLPDLPEMREAKNHIRKMLHQA